MVAGKPKQVDAGTLYSFAHQFYWDFKRLGEGGYRPSTNKQEAEELIAAFGDGQLSDEQKIQIEQRAEKEINGGRLSRADKEEWLRREEVALLMATREWFRRLAFERSTRSLKVPGEPDVVDALLHAATAEKVCVICKDASVRRKIIAVDGREIVVEMPNWPVGVGVLPHYLSKYASEFVAAKKDSRFPRSGRPSTEPKQLWFLSRALAGAVFGITARTAINLVGSQRPDQTFDESHAAKPSRMKRRKK